MIRAIAHHQNGLPIVMLGLDTSNIDRLAAGDPIKINLYHLTGLEPMPSLPDIDVVIFAASSDRAEVLQRLGVT